MNSAASAPTMAKATTPASRVHACAKIAKITSITTAAIHAPRDRVSTSDAATIAAPSDAMTNVAARCARMAMRKSSGRPIAATWAMKLRLPSVPPGTRVSAKSGVRRP